MNLSPQGKQILRILEGEKLEAYPDSHGIPTIGIGMTFYPVNLNKFEAGQKVKLGDVLTQEESDLFFFHMTIDFERFVDSITLDHITQHEFDALVCFCYNVGKSGYRDSDLRKIVNKPGFNRGTAERKFFNWIRPNLAYRRHVEANLFMGRFWL